MIVFVTGTGTDVGKTHVSCALLAALRTGAPDLRVQAWKPVLTGISPTGDDGAEPTDRDRHAIHLGHPTPDPAHVFVPPISPHLAAREAGVRLCIHRLATAALTHAEGTDVLLVEGAGGLFSPIADDTTYADLAGVLRARIGDRLRVLLVAPDRLGVLHDLRASLLAARHVGAPVTALALSAPAVPDASTGRNAEEVRRLFIGPLAAVFPRAEPESPASASAARATWKKLDRRLYRRLDDAARG